MTHWQTDVQQAIEKDIGIMSSSFHLRLTCDLSVSVFFSLCRLGHGHLLPSLWEAFPDPDSTAAAHGSARRRSQLHLQRMQPYFPQPYCTQTPPPLTHRSVEALGVRLHCWWDRGIFRTWCLSILLRFDSSSSVLQLFTLNSAVTMQHALNVLLYLFNVTF